MLVEKGYKQTEFGMIPEDWEVSSLGEVGEVKMCRRIFNHETSYIGAIPFFKIGTFGKEPDAFITREKYEDYRKKYPFPRKGDILISAAGTIGRTIKYNGEDAYFQDSNIVWIDNDFCTVSNDFLYHIYQVVKYNTEGGTIQRLYNTILKATKFVLPPLPEQTAIATALSDMDALIAKTEQLIEKKKAIKQGVMQELLTGRTRLPGFENNKGYRHTEVGLIPEDWEVKELGEIGNVIIGLTYSPDDVAEYGTLVLRSSNIQNNRLAFVNNVFVNMDLPDRVMVKDRDLLICVRNGSRNLIGKSALIDKSAEGAAFGAFMSVFRSDINNYVSILFQSNIIQQQIENNLGATINQITNKDLKSFKVPLPPLPEQTAIAEALSALDENLTLLDAKLQKLKLQKQGMMQALLTGKIRLV